MLRCLFCRLSSRGLLQSTDTQSPTWEQKSDRAFPRVKQTEVSIVIVQDAHELMWCLIIFSNGRNQNVPFALEAYISFNNLRVYKPIKIKYTLETIKYTEPASWWNSQYPLFLSTGTFWALISKQRDTRGYITDPTLDIWLFHMYQLF